MSTNGNEDFGSGLSPEGTAARRDPMASLYRDHKPLRDRLAARVQTPAPKGARPLRNILASLLTAGVIIVAIVLLIVAVRFALHSFWDAIMLGWRIA